MKKFARIELKVSSFCKMFYELTYKLYYKIRILNVKAAPRNMHQGS